MDQMNDDDIDLEALERQILSEVENPAKENQSQIRDDPNFLLENSTEDKSTEGKPAKRTSLVDFLRTQKNVQEEAQDSSEDEDHRNFLEQKYNEYGRGIKQNIRQQENEMKQNVVAREVQQSLKRENSSSSLSKSFSSKPVKSEAQQKQIGDFFPKSTVYTDPIFGLRLTKPLISSTVLVERMEGRMAVPFARVRFHTERGDRNKDWVIAGIIVSKSPARTSQKGKTYSIWKLSDLKGTIKTVSLFLFSGAHKDLWKTVEGTAVGVLNPNVLERKDEKGDEAVLSIDNAQKVMILGESRDAGRCKSRKKNGDPCGALVNRNECEYCVYHVRQEYRSASNRPEFQSATGGRLAAGGLNELRNKVLGKSEVFYGGQLYAAIPAKKNPKLEAKDNQRLMKLSEYQAKSNAALQSRDQDRLSKLGSSPSISTVPFSSPKLSPISRISLPKLSAESFTVDLSMSARQAEAAKQRAIALLKKKPLEKSDPNMIKYRGTAEGKKRALEELENASEEHQTKRAKVEEDEKAKRERLLAIMNAKSSHADLVDQHEIEQREKYFNVLEKKEAMEEKMLTITKVACKAVVCLKCSYTAFSAADRCKEEQHPLRVKDAEKRFFVCKDCGNRTVTLHRIPKVSCTKCQGSRWERCGMMKERNVKTGEALSIRGDEETFIGSLQTGGNLNLLVPEEN